MYWLKIFQALPYKMVVRKKEAMFKVNFVVTNLLELQTINLILFLFFYFLLIYFLFRVLGLRFSITQHVSVTNSHMIIEKRIEGSRRNNVIQYVIYILILRQMHGYLG